MKVNFIVILFFSLLSFGLRASFLAPEWSQAEHLTTKMTPAFPYVRLKREGATPIVLLHGIGGNQHNWMDFAPGLYKMGYDVWAFRWAVKGAGDLDQLATSALPQFLKLVKRSTRQKPFLIGHSLGGIISKIYLLGLRKNSAGKYFVSKREKRLAARNVRGFVSLASPNGKENNSLQYFMPIFENIPTFQIYGIGDLTSTIKSGKYGFETALVKTIEFNALGMRLPLLDEFMNIIFHLPYHDYSDYNIGSVLRFGISSIPAGVQRQIRELGDEIRQNPDQTSMADILYNEPRIIPFAYVAGEKDPIASATAIADEARAQKAPFLLLEKGGHLDPLFGDMMVETLLFVNRFILSVL